MFIGFYISQDLCKMRSLTFVLFVLCSPSCIFGDPSVRGPPHVTGEMSPSYSAKIGDTVKIDCPIDSGPSLSIYYDWKKDGETITTAWDRFRVMPKKLRIKGVLAEDGGVFQCKGTNGFGSKELSTRLVVHDEAGNIVGGAETEDIYPDEVEGLRPSFTEITAPTAGSTFRPYVGSTLSLRCRADGQPSPSVAWFRIKDEVPLPRVSGQQLDLTSLKYEDSGVYVCVASNLYGQINASFIVDVVERGLEGPSIISLEPSNLTVVRGQQIHFRCLIRSDTKPTVQWLRELDSEELRANNKSGVEMGGVRYKVINNGTRVSSFENGTYLGDLSLQADTRDYTAYVCLATNSGGFNFHKSFINIQSSESFLPIGVLIAIPSTILLLFTTLAIVICCVRRSQAQVSSGGSPTVTTTTTYATPRDAMNNEYQSAPSHPFFNPRHPHHHQLLAHPNSLRNPSTNGQISHFGGQQYFTKETLASNGSPIKNHLQGHHHFSNSSPAYASVPICDPTAGVNTTSSFGVTPCRGPPLPSRPNFTNPSSRDRNGYNNQGLLTQPLLTQTASSSDSRDSRQSGGAYRGVNGGVPDYNPPVMLVSSQRPGVVDHWCTSSGASEGSWDRKNSRGHNHQIRL